MSEELETQHLAPANMDHEPQIADLSLDAVEIPPRSTTPPTPEDLSAVYDVPVKVQAVLGRSRMDIGELLRLKPGMVVELDRRVGEPVEIFVNNRLIARGEVVLIDSALGITLTEIVRQEG